MVTGGIIQPAPRVQVVTRYGLRTPPRQLPAAPAQLAATPAEPATVFPTYEKDGVAYYDLDKIYKDGQLRGVFEEQYPQAKEYFTELDKPQPVQEQLPVTITQVPTVETKPPSSEAEKRVFSALGEKGLAQYRHNQQLQPYLAQQASTITLSGGEQIDWVAYRDLPPDLQEKLLAAGSIEAFNQQIESENIHAQADFAANTIQLPSGEYVNREAYAGLSEEQKQVLEDEGVGALQGLIEVQQAAQERAAKNYEIKAAESQKEYEAQIAALPLADQQYIQQFGVQAYNEQQQREAATIQSSFTAAQPFITTDPETGAQTIDIVRAINEGNVTQKDLNNLGITDQQIADAYAGYVSPVGVPFDAALYTTTPITVGGKVGGHEVFEELIPYTNSTGTQVNAVQYLIDTNLDPNSVKVLQQVIPDETIAQSLVMANAINVVKQYGNDPVQLMVENPDIAPTILAQAGYSQDAIEAAELVASQPATPKLASVIWQAITPWKEEKGETFGDAVKKFFTSPFTGSQYKYWESPEGQAELAQKYAEQQTVAGKILGHLDPVGSFVAYDETSGKYYQVLAGFLPDFTPQRAPGQSQQLKSMRVKTTELSISRAEMESAVNDALQILKNAKARQAIEDINKAKLIEAVKKANGMNDLEVFLRSKDLNKAWNEIVIRKLMDKVLIEQEQSAKLAAAARELKTTGQITLQIPQISTLGINATNVVVTTGKAIAATADIVKAVQTYPGIGAAPITSSSQATLVDIAQKTGLSNAQIQKALSSGTLPQTITTNIQTKSIVLSNADSLRLATALTNIAPQIKTSLTTATETLIKPATKTDLQVKTETLTIPATITTTTTPIPTPTPTPTAITVPYPLPQPYPVPAPAPTPTPTTSPTPRPTPKAPRLRPPGKPRGKSRFNLPSVELSTKEKRRLFRGAIAWEQGFGWWAIKPPYASKDDTAFFYKTPPPGAKKMKGGAGEAYRSIQAIKGTAPRQLFVDMGIMDVVITAPKETPGGKGAIKFVRDIKQNTKGDIELGGSGMQTPQDVARELSNLPPEQAQARLALMPDREAALVRFYMAQRAVPMPAAPAKVAKPTKPKAKRKKSSTSSLISQIIMGR